MAEKVIQMIWIDKGKNDIFNLSIASWLAHGYKIDLYTNNMNMVDNSLVNHIDYRTIMDIETDDILHLADLLRFKLLYEKGGIYVDCDMILVNDYDFNSDKIIISSEYTMQSGPFKSLDNCVPNIGILKFPPYHPFMAKLINIIETKIVNDVDVCQFQKIYQKQLKTKRFQYLNHCVKKPRTYCGIPWWNAAEIYQDVGVYTDKYKVPTPSVTLLLKYSTCIHLWNNISNNKYEIDFKNPIKGSVYHILRQRFSL
jgi:hypothetical protein